MLTHTRILAALLLASALACRTAAPVAEQPQDTVAAAPTSAPGPAAAVYSPTTLASGLSAPAMNLAVSPCDDFYEHACGGWIQATEIPPDRPRWGRGLDGLLARNEDVLREILEATAAGKPPEGTPFAKELAALHSACMDEGALEKALPAFHAEARALKTDSPKNLARSVAALHARGAPALFVFGPVQDYADATQVIGQVDQGGLGLPDRDYYVSDAPNMKAIRDAYLAHVERMFALTNIYPEHARSNAVAVLALETALAKASLPKVDRRDPRNMYHRLDRKGLAAAAPRFLWADYFKAVGAPGLDALNVTHVPFFEELNARLEASATSPTDWEAYLSWHLLRASLLGLPKALQEESFRFNAEHLTGAKEDVPRWKKCARLSEALMPHAVSVPFVARTFGADGKARMDRMVRDVEAAFERNLDTLDWMDAATKAGALEKIRKVVNKVGYPEQWRSYAGLQINPRSLLASMRAGEAFEVKRQLAKIGKPVDRAEWLMSPAQVNAYYHALMNEIVFLAGILQPPYFSREASEPVNYGSIGMVVGHEFSHGFDDKGRKFDEDGNLRDWWSESSGKQFVEKARCVERQFSAYTAVDELKVNGALTLGENVADLAGLKLAHSAMAKRLQEEPALAGPSSLTPSQQFFLGYAQAWCSKTRQAFARQKVLVDSHSPPNLRVNGPLGNMPQFQEAFGCAADSKMMRPAAQRCAVW